jgi:hypothetical protein
MRPFTPTPLLAAVALAALSLPAAANRIHTGGETGAYHRDFCPAVARELTTAGQPYTCTTSAGAKDNMERVRQSPRELGFGQLDVFALETQLASNLQVVRHDDARECVFAVTRNRQITSYGELAAYASSSRFFLPPQASGSAGTFQYMRRLDRNGIGRAPGSAITHVQGGTDEAIRAALNRDDGVAFFVQYPDPENERFKLVRDLGGHFVPVVDRVFLDQMINGMTVYAAQDTRITNSRRLESGGRVTTICTPIVLFTGDERRIRDSGEQRQHRELVTAIRGLTKDAVLPRQTPLRQAMEKTRELTAEARARMTAYSQRARDRALPFLSRMVERAAPRGDWGSSSGSGGGWFSSPWSTSSSARSSPNWD